MEKISDIERQSKVRKPYAVSVPDFSDLNKIYSVGVAMNDIDIALRKRELRDTISSMLVDTSPEPAPFLDDESLFDAFIGKECEVPEIYQSMKAIEAEFKRSKSD